MRRAGIGVPPCGVVSLLDERSTERVEATWKQLERELGLRGVLSMPFPHFSYQIAEGYEREAAEATLAELARSIAPFTITTTGISTFPEPWPVVFVAIDRVPYLRTLHERIFSACAPHARAPLDYYRPERWTPHITLAHGEERNSVPLPAETVRTIVATLDPVGYRWTVPIDNLALVWDEGTVQRPVRRFRLSGQRPVK